MAYHLRNEHNPDLSLAINGQTWDALLDLAEEHGWNPLGTMLPEWQVWAVGLGDSDAEGPCLGSYTPDCIRLVALEDALNLGEALERAFLAYEPQRVHSYSELALIGVAEPAGPRRPSIGAIAAAADFCRQGAFWIELKSH
jgi:hypothetical protein